MSNELIQFIISNEALSFGNFKLKSGRESPYFINVGKLFATGEKLSFITNQFVSFILENSLLDDIDFLFGPSYKGIPLVTAVALKLNEHGYNLRWGYNRKQVKDYGINSERIIIGDIRQDDNILIIDDVLTTGLTHYKLQSLFKKNQIKSILTLIDRKESDPAQWRNWLREFNINIYTIVNIDKILIAYDSYKSLGTLLKNRILRYRKNFEYVPNIDRYSSWKKFKSRIQVEE